MSAAGAGVGAVIVHYRAPDELRACLESLARQTVPPHRIVVVDNGDGGDCRDLAADFGAQLCPMYSNRGFAAAANAGLELLAPQCDAVLVLSHDAKLASDALESMANALANAPDVAVVGPLLGDGRARELVWSAGGSVRRLTDLPFHLCAGEPLRLVLGADPVQVDWLDGACTLIRSDAYRDIGGLDESWFLYVEELDWQLRLQAASWRLLCDRRVVVWQTPGLMSPYLEARNLLRFTVRRGNLIGIGAVLYRQARGMARAAVQGRFREGRLRALGLLHGLTGRLDVAAALLR